jgi:SAM-dependent methyltransferase
MITPELSSLAAIRARLDASAGGGKRLALGLRASRGLGLYSTMTLPGLEDVPAVRDTRERLRHFGVAEDLRSTTVLDVGSNQGSFSFEFALRGAHVLGVEFRADRVELCAEMSRLWGVGNATFVADDFVSGDWARAMIRDGDVARVMDGFDLVWCTCVTKFVPDDQLNAFYARLRSATRPEGRLMLECNRAARRTELELMLNLHGFSKIEHLGDSGPRRRSMICS